MASQIWADEILPHWDREATSKRTLRLWSEGIPSMLRRDVWSRVLAAHPTPHLATNAAPATSASPATAMPSSSSSAPASASAADAAPPPSLSELTTLVSAHDRSLALDSLRSSLTPTAAHLSPPPELNMFTSPESPLRASLERLLSCMYAASRHAGPPVPPAAPLLGCMLLLYMEEEDALHALSALASHHCVGRRPDEHGAWRLDAAEAMIRCQLPSLHEHLRGLGVATSSWMVAWHASLFVSTLPLDSAARVWDCYLRDGEPFLWRASLSLLRLLHTRLLACHTADECLQLLCQARTSEAVHEKALFHTSSATPAPPTTTPSSPRVWHSLSQRMPMPTAEEGTRRVCYDLWRNSPLAPHSPTTRRARAPARDAPPPTLTPSLMSSLTPTRGAAAPRARAGAPRRWRALCPTRRLAAAAPRRPSRAEAPTAVRGRPRRAREQAERLLPAALLHQ